MFVQRRWMRRTDCRRLTEQQWNPPLHFRRQSYSTPVKVRNAVLDKWRERAADLAAHSEHAHSSGDRNIHLNAAEYNSPFPSHVIVLQMSNTSGILVLVIHSSYHNECHVTFCCSCLVSMTPGWRSTTLWANSMKLNMTRSASNLETWKKISKRHYSKQSVSPPLQHKRSTVSAEVVLCVMIMQCISFDLTTRHYFQETTSVSNSALQWADSPDAPARQDSLWELTDARVKVRK